MSEIITIGRRLIPLDHIALVEPFDPATSRIQTAKEFKARVVMIDRESVLTEDAPAAFAESHGLRMLPDEGIAVSRSVHFGVEHFEPADGFNPPKPYRSRLVWRDQDGNTQSKLLLSAAEDIVALVTGTASAETRPTVTTIRAARLRGRRVMARRGAAEP